MSPSLRYICLTALAAGLVSGQTMPWYLQSQYPASGASGVPTNVIIQLDEARAVLERQPAYTLTARTGTKIPLAQNGYNNAVSLAPSAALAGSTEYTFTVTPDPSVGTPYSFSFTTGSGPDKSPPHLIGFSPASGATGVGIQGPFTALFDKRLLNTSAARGLGVVAASQGGGTQSNVAVTSPTADGMGIAIQLPNEGFTTFLQLTVDPTKFQDAFGNPGQGIPQTAHYTTFVATDLSGPSLRAFFPADGDQALPVNVSIRLLFDRPVDLATASSGIVLSSNGNTVPVTFVAFAAGSGVALKPAGLLAPNQIFQVSVSPALLDLTESPAPQSWSFQFRTGANPDGVTAAAVSYAPSGNSSGVPLNAVFAVRANKRIMPLAAVEYVSLNIGNGGNRGPAVAATASISPDGQTFTLTPVAPLAPLQGYIADLTDLVDITGSQFLSGAGFTTGTAEDNIPPAVLAVIPVDGAQGIAATTPIQVLFNDLPGAPQTDALSLTANGQTVPSKFNLSSSLLTVTPSVPLAANTTYTLAVGGLTNLAGIAFPPLSATFTTDANPAPATSVQLLSTSPLADTQGADVNSQIVFTFDSPLNSLTAFTGFTVSDAATGTYPATATVSGANLTITPSHPLLRNSVITARVTTTDVLGRYINTQVTFTTGASQDATPLQVTSVSPPDGATITGPVRTITLTFNKPVDAATIAAGLAAYSNGAPISVTTVRTNQDTSLVITPRIDPSGDLTLLAASALTDLAGNPLAPFRATFTFQPVNQAAAYARTALFMRPPSGATGVPPNTPITWFLSYPTDLATVNASLVVTANGAPVSGQFSLSPDGTILTFQAGAPFPAGAIVRFYQRSPIFTDNYNSSLTIVAPSAYPALMRYTPSGASAPANSAIELEFSTDVSPSQNLAGLYLARVPNSLLPGTQVAADASRPRAGVIRLTPGAPLTPGDYIIALAPSVNNPLTNFQPNYIPFHATAPVSATPRLPLTAPQANSTGTPVNASVSATFNVALNPLTVIPGSFTIQSGGSLIPSLLYLSQNGKGLLLTPTLPLPPNAEIDVVITGLEDLYGSPVPGKSWSFVTGAAADFSPATALSSIPLTLPYGSLPQIPSSEPVVLVFNKPMDPRSLASGLSSGLPPLDATWSDDLQTAILTFNPPLYKGRQYNLYLPAVADLSGNAASGPGQLNFEVAFDADTTAPRFQLASPSDGQTGLPLNTQIMATFDKPLLPTSFGNVQLLQNGAPVPLVQQSADSNRLRFAPVRPLFANTTYSLSIAGVSDLSGNAMAGAVTGTFTTADGIDAVAPSLQFLASGAPNVPIRIVFSKPMSPATVDSTSIVLNVASNNLSSWYWIPTASVVTLSGDGLTATVTPSAPLKPGWRYQLTVTNVRDFAGNTVSSNSPSATFVTTAIPDIAPPVLLITPPDAAAGVPLGTRVAATSNKQLPPQSASLFQLSTNGQAVPGTVRQSNSGFVFTPAAPLISSTTYRIDVGPLTDLAGNVSAPVSTTFTTSAPTDRRPQFRFLSSTPADGDVGVDSNSPITLTFSEPVDPATAFFGIQISTSFPTPRTLSASGNTVTLTPSEPWASAANVTVNLQGGNSSVRDLAGLTLAIPYAVIGFRTVATADPTPPQLLSVSPQAGTTLAPPSADFRLTFSKTVSVGPYGLAYFSGTQSTPINFSYDATDYHTLFFSPNVPANSPLTILGTDAIVDRSGNPVTPFTLQYPTGDAQEFGRPSITGIAPNYGNNVSATAVIVLQFNKSVDPQSALQSVRVTQDGNNITGQLVLSNSNRTIQFTPDQPWQAGSRIDVYVLETLADPAGVTSGSRFNSWFLIAPAPLSMQVSQTGFGATVAPEAALELGFDQPIDQRTAIDANVWLRAGQRAIPGVTAVRESKIVRFVPDAPLEPGLEYALTVGRGLHSAAGTETQPAEFHFRVANADTMTEPESVRARSGVIHLKFPAPVNPLSVANARLVRSDGTEIPVTRRISADFQELWLTPATGEAGTLSIEGMEDRTGRPVARKPK
jgi:large repetitive protein